MDEYKSKVKLKFKILAAFYDLFDLAFLLDKKRNPRYSLTRQIPNEPLHILDVCVGTANSSIILAEANAKNTVVGIDLSPDMIAVAQRKIRRHRLRNISIREMDASDMAFKDGTYDIVMISFGLHEMEYGLMVKILKEMHRVLKTGGRLLIIDYEVGEGLIENHLFRLFLMLFEPKHMSQFLKYDWEKLLLGLDFQLGNIETHLYSKLITATR